MLAIKIILSILLLIFCMLGELVGLGYLLQAATENDVYLLTEALIEIPGNVLALALGLDGPLVGTTA